MVKRNLMRRLEQLEAEAERQAAAEQRAIAQQEEAKAEWSRRIEEMRYELATVPVEGLLNRRPEELVIWAEIHRPELARGMAERVVEIYSENPLEEIWGVGQAEWYFDLCRLLQAPYQRKLWMDARLPRPPHVYWPGDPNYEQRLK